MLDKLRTGLTQLGVATANPLAFLIVAGYGIAWSLASPATLEWHAVATMATWLMTLFIQRAQHRDTQAIQAKLDELLHAHSGASNMLMHIDEQEPEDIAKARERARKE